MKILVTGGAGFIGSNFVRYYLNKHSDDTLINLDSLTYAGNLANLQDLEKNPRYQFVKGDICDEQLLAKLFADQKIDGVINFAAESHVDRSILSAAEFLRTNIIGTQVLLDAAKKNKCSRFLQVSTDEVYGSLGATGRFSETTPISPNSPYSASKASADLLARSYFETYKFPVLISRCSNNYGPYQFPEKLIPLMITNAMEDKELPVYGDGQNVRDWIAVEDHCRALDLIYHKGKLGEVYNVGGNCEMPNIEIVKTILSIVGKSDKLIRYVTDRPGHDRRYAIDFSKIEAELGWQPIEKFPDYIKKTVNWYKENRQWWQQIKSGEYQHYYEKQYARR